MMQRQWEALDLLAELVEATFVDSSLRADWRAFVTEVDAEGWLAKLDEHDARGVAVILFVDLSSNPDGSHYLRWRAELLRRNDAPEIGVLFGGDVHDPVAVADALDAVASSVCKAAPAGLDQ